MRTYSYPVAVMNLAFLMLSNFTAVALAQSQSGVARPKPIAGAPDWLADYKFPDQKFTFVRIQYTSVGTRPGPHWATDYPDAEINLSAQLKLLTSLDVAEQGKVHKLTDPALSEYPFVYMVEPGRLELSTAEVTALRKYLLQGGFLMADDFWGEFEWKQFHSQMKRVFPNRELEELPLEHEIFHCVFDLKEKPQVPSIHVALTGGTTEREDAQQAHYKAITDDKGRVMVLSCHNTDLADGWERSDNDQRYYRNFSEKKAYPMGINIVFYALTQDN